MQPTEFEKAFVELYPRVVRLAYRILADWPASEDVAAESFLRALTAWDRLENAEAWIVRVATNLAVERTRDKPPAAGWDLAFDPTDLMTVRLALVEALRALPARQRESIALRYFGDLKQSEVAQVLGLSEGSVKTHVHRGIAALRAQLVEEAADMGIASIDDAVRAMDSGDVVTGLVLDAASFGPRRGGGFRVDIGVPALMHNRDASLELGFRGEDMRWLVGVPVDVKVVSVDRDANEVFVSRRAVLETERISALRRALLEELKPGQKRTGKVTLVLPFGAFVDLDGSYGVLPASEFASPEELEELRTREGREAFKDRRNATATDGIVRGRGVRVEIVGVDVERQRASLRLVGT